MSAKAPSASPKSKGKAKAKAKGRAKSSGAASGGQLGNLGPNDSVVAVLAEQGKITAQVKTSLAAADTSWAEGFRGLPLHTCNMATELPVPPTLNSAQERIWRRMFEKGQEAINADRAMGEIVAYQKSNLADPDTAVVVDHVAVFIKWFAAQFEAALGFMDDLGDDDDDEH
eukprot:TRINITY_DN2076_c0_g1_i2.p1 TRINITY_DN2076_c0_g1~~TRINITY_DN2076_c0_g1_i2.p1  ORF type:complete len:171 (-),score=46.46 TRINITY_DN2076_c0_g1_i2:57-569(-)